MFPEAATIARRRHLATIFVRTLMAGSVLTFAFRVFANFGENIAQLSAPPFSEVGQSIGRNVGWLVLAALLWLIERPLLRWIVPPPQPGCPNCGYSLRNLRTPICPECGADLAPSRSGTGS